MWVFLATEIHLFGGAFCTFAFYRWRYLELFNQSASHLNVWMGFTNTLVLLTSSWTMVLAVDAAQRGRNRACGIRSLITIALGIMFFIIKGFEYSAKFSHGIYPSTNIFWGLYFTMTGIHAFHVLVGLGLIFWLYLLSRKNRFSETYYTPVEVIGLYWHLVDVIWIFLFPLLYLLPGFGAGTH